MLISGLWKLAAMAGVIGVGLVAVFQAQQGLEQPSTVAMNFGEPEVVGEPGSEDNAPPAEPDSQSTPVSTASSEEEPLKLTDPFVGSSTHTTAAAAPLALPDVTETAEPLPRTANSELPLTPDNAKPIKTAQSTSASTVSGPGLDFRSDSANSGPILNTDTAKSSIQQAGFEESAPGRLPEEPDPFSESTAPPTAVPAQPFVRQTTDTKPAPASGAKAGSDDADPFFNSDPGEGAAADPATPSTPPATEPSLELEPLGESPRRDRAPVRAEPELDPFDGAAPADSKNPATTTEPAPMEPTPATDSADPFGDPGTAPPALTPTDLKPKSPVLESQEDSIPARGGSPGLRLPTEVPSGIDLPGDNGSTIRPREPMRTREPTRTREPLPERNRPADTPEPTASDLTGDGVVTENAPRGIQQPRITIEKIAPQQCVLGEPLVYSVIIKNIGGSEAHHVVVEDRIPKGTELSGTAPRAEMVEKKLIWRIGTLKPNEEKKISIRVIPRQEGSIGSVARVNFAAEVAAEIIVSAPQLSLKVNAPSEVRIGETIDLTFLLKNSGGAAANNVSVRDLIPEGLKHEAAADIECPIGKLGPNESREIVLQVTAVKPGRVKNRAILTADGGFTQELDSIIDIVGEHLVLTRTGQNRIYAERPAVFTNNVKNEGNAQVNRVRVSEIVPAGLEFVEASDGGQFDPAERMIHWTVGPLAPGAETTVSAKLIAKVPGSQLGTISATGSAGSAASVKSEVEVIGRPELQMETLNATGVVAVGDRLTSKIQLKNNGSAPARNVALSISVPPEMKLIEVRGARYQQTKNVVRFEPLAELAPRDGATFEVVMEAMTEADAKMDLQITADHLTKPARRSESVQIANEVR